MASALASTMIYALGEGSGYSAMRGAPLINLSVREALSGVMGSISLVSWIVLLVSQPGQLLHAELLDGYTVVSERRNDIWNELR